MALYLGDKDGNRMGCIAYNHNSEGDIGIILQGYRKYNNNDIFNTLNLSIGSNGQNKVTVSAPTAWREALGLMPKNITISLLSCSGWVTSSSKVISFLIPYANYYTTAPKLTYLALCLRGGAGQDYLYEASGTNNATYTQLGTQPVVVWENSKTKRINGVDEKNTNISNRYGSGFFVNVTFKNTLRKSASTTVAQNNAPIAICLIANISFEN